MTDGKNNRFHLVSNMRCCAEQCFRALD
jgi:hypothetical protein